MRSVQLTIPGKTFLAGEYLALKGLGALVLATKPRFEVLIHENETEDPSEKNPFHTDSPAGLFWQEQSSFFKKYSVQLKTFSGLGGWGASTAEFIALQGLWQLKDSLWIEEERFFDLHKMLLDYRRLAGGKTKEAGFPPSGADLVGQVRGGLTFFEGQNGKIQTFAWPFANLKMKLIATGKKLPTHEHLAKLKDFSTDELAWALEKCHLGLKTVDESLFVSGILQAALGLASLGFVAPETQKLLAQFDKLSGVVASKGCGALGADVIAILFREPQCGLAIEAKASELGLRIVATEASIADGLSVQNIF